MSSIPHIVPQPAEIEPREGVFHLTAETRVQWTGEGAQPVAELLAEYLRPATGFALPVVAAESGGKTETDIRLTQTGDPQPDAAGFVPEAYTCEVSPAAVTLQAESATGLARGIQTLRQMLPAAIFASKAQQEDWAIPAVRINDKPRFRWRGLHFDVSRHFFSVAEVCRFIELLAMHRMNTCHLHLTDDQGWRLEIKKYPRLTEVGAVRDQTLVGHERDRPRRYDGQRYSGFFTQAEAREIVAFAARRHITVVPEIEMPGHAQAVIAAYPELGNTNATISPRCHWGISQEVLNAEDATIKFMCNVLDEVMDIFPSRFIHIGGDEAPKHQWSESARAQQRMAELGLASEAELQSWFVRQIDNHITAHGRRLIGWDEIIEGGLAKGATVMSWRSEEGGVTAAKAGHDVVMAPCAWIYLDRYQVHTTSEEPLCIGGVIPTDRVYAYEPVPAQMPADVSHHVLGAQGELWTEYVPDFDHLEYMAYPRACALAETLWLQPEQKSYASFLDRLRHHRDRLAALNVNAHPLP